MRARSELQTAIGGTVLGMSLGLFMLPLVLRTPAAGWFGLDPGTIDLTLPFISMLSGLMLFISGSFLLWGGLLETPVQRRVPRRPTPVRGTREVPRVWAPPRRGVGLDMRRVSHRSTATRAAPPRQQRARARARV